MVDVSSVAQNWTSWNLSIQVPTTNNTTSRSKDSTKLYPVCIMKSSHIFPNYSFILIHYKVCGANLDSVFPFHICTSPMNPHAMCTCTHLHLSMSEPNKPRSFKPCWTFLDFWRGCVTLACCTKDQWGHLVWIVKKGSSKCWVIFLSLLYRLLGARVECTSTQTKVLLDHSRGTLCLDYLVGSFSSCPYPPLKKGHGEFQCMDLCMVTLYSSGWEMHLLGVH